MKILWGIILLVFQVHAYELINGHVTFLMFDTNETKALYKDGVSIPLLKHPTRQDKAIALLAVSYRHSEPITLLHVKQHEKETFKLSITKGIYAQEVLSVEPSKVSPPKEMLSRIKAEAEEAKALYATFTPKRYWNSPFISPLQNPITSEYGTARVFNDTLQSYHSGVDFRASVGTPIVASNDGVVVIAKERYYAGGSVVIDHGEGIYSVYYHLSSIAPKVGDRLKKGEFLGLSGATGRVTGPHLHFGFMVQGIPVEPLDFMKKFNTLF